MRYFMIAASVAFGALSLLVLVMASFILDSGFAELAKPQPFHPEIPLGLGALAALLGFAGSAASALCFCYRD